MEMEELLICIAPPAVRKHVSNSDSILIISDEKQRLRWVERTDCLAGKSKQNFEILGPTWVAGFPCRAPPVGLGKSQTEWRVLIYKIGVLLLKQNYIQIDSPSKQIHT